MKKALKSIFSITLCLIMLLGTISGTFMRFCDIIKNPFSLSLAVAPRKSAYFYVQKNGHLPFLESVRKLIMVINRLLRTQ